ncbi:MAG: DUF2029 domain-containing protein [Candidatus Obscuribacterales bacterium]|nr:DUF2029 domain-containing protein [Candidatus Obscuribacterales bacterium]
MNAPNKLSDKLNFALISAICLWALFAYLKLGQYAAEGELFARVIDKHVYINDFTNIYNAAILAKRSFTSDIDIYDINVQSQSLNSLVAPIVPELPFFSHYPPPFFLLTLPLAWLDMQGAWLLWTTTGACFSLIAVRALCLEAGLNRKQTTTSMLLTICSFPAWFSVELGQTSLYFFPLLTLFFLSLKSKRQFMAGFAYALATIKLQYAPLLGIVGLLLGGLRFVSGTFALLLLLLSGSVALFGWACISGYPQALLTAETSPGVSGIVANFMQNFRGELILLAGSDSSPTRLSAFAFLLVIILFTSWLWYKKRQSFNDEAFKIFASLSVLFLLISSPHCHTQDYLAATLPCIWLWQWANKSWIDSQRKPLLWIKTLCVSFPWLSWFFFYLNPLFQLLRLQPFFVWAVLLIVLILGEFLLEQKNKKPE